MDKAAVIARVASDPADRLLLARLYDKLTAAERRATFSSPVPGGSRPWPRPC